MEEELDIIDIVQSFQKLAEFYLAISRGSTPRICELWRLCLVFSIVYYFESIC
jgi:hypothetical protein